MAEQLGAAELQLDVNSSNFKTKLDAAEAQLIAFQRVGDSVGTSLTDIFAKNYRINVTDSQVDAANIRLDKTLAKLKEITANPYNIRLNFIQSGAGTGGGGKFDPGRIVDDAIGRILEEGLSGQASQILREGAGEAGAGRVGAARSQQLRETLLARVERGSLGAGGFNIPGLQEIIRQLGQTPLPRTAGRAKILQQARETIQQASNTVLNRIGQDLLDLQMSFSGGPGMRPRPFGTPPPPPPPPPRQRPAPPAPAAQPREPFFRGSARDAISSGTIGFGFPLLFGQGLGAAAGGGIGGAAGGLAGGGFGFALSIIGTAVGAQFDVLIAKSKDLASALSDPIASFDLLKQNSQLSSRGTERYIEALIKVGREGEAAALIQQDLSNTYGNLDDARNLAKAQDELARSWSKLSNILAGGLLPGLASFTGNIASLLEEVSGGNRQGTNAPQRGSGARPTPGGNGLGSAALNFGLFALSPSLFFLNQMGGRARGAQQGAAQRPLPTSPEAEQAQKDRASLLSNELRLIQAQTQGYKEQELRLKLAVAADKERVDLAALRLRLEKASPDAKPALQVEIDARTTQGLKERLQLQEELAEVQRKNRISQETRPAIQKQSLALLNAQVTGAHRQALIEERRLSILETERQLRLEGNRDPVRRGEIMDQGLLAQARLTAQLAQLDKERAALARQTTFDAREQAQVGQRQLTFARQRLGTEAGIVRQTLEQRQAAIEAIAAATERQQRAQFSFTEALRQGGDAGQQRAFEIAAKDIPEAGRQLQLSLINGATAIKDAGRDLSRNLEENARSLQNLYLTSEFATSEQRQRATADLDRQVEAEARRRNVLFTVSGDERQRTAAKQGFLDFGRQESELIRQGNQLAEALSIANKPLVDSNTGLVSNLTTLIEAIGTLNQKNWAVNLSVASDGTVSPTGDILSRAAGAL